MHHNYSLQPTKRFNSIRVLDMYSAMIVSVYFQTKTDFLNLIQTTKKFVNILDHFHYNPIPVSSKVLFPSMETQHIFDVNDKLIPDMFAYVIWFEVPFKKASICDTSSNIKHKNSGFTQTDLFNWKKNHVDDCDQNNSLLSISLPTVIRSIYEETFCDCHYLQKIILPPLLKRLGDRAFYGCCSLTSLSFPRSLSIIGSNCFGGCSKLKHIEISDSTNFNGLVPYWMSQILQNQNIRCANVEFTIDDREIWEKSHRRDCTKTNELKTIRIPTSIQTISSMCFYECRSLKSIFIPTTVTQLGNYCFSGCCNLKTLTIPSTICCFGKNCFQGCDSLQDDFI